MRDGVLRALRGEVVAPRPVWLMRQAGRYLPGYRKLRAQHPILEIARTPELAAAVTLEPVHEFDLDAGVVFADITLPFFGLGVPFRIDPGVGPVIPQPIRNRPAVDALTPFDAPKSVAFVAEAIVRFREAEPEIPLVGFAGAPFTLSAYLVEGGASRDFAHAKRLLYSDPETYGALLERLTDATVDYLTLQARAGAHALQLFDTWAGVLSKPAFDTHVLPRLQALFHRLQSLRVPTIYFSTGSAHLLPSLASVGADALGVDWRTPLGAVRAVVGPEHPLQGNLDPAALLAPRSRLEAMVHEVLREIPDGSGHVFNLGHGVLPETPPQAVRHLVDAVRRATNPRK